MHSEQKRPFGCLGGHPCWEKGHFPDIGPSGEWTQDLGRGGEGGDPNAWPRGMVKVC